jgi:hypothetical protein
MQCERRPADAAFLIDERDDHIRAPEPAGPFALMGGRES